MKTLTGAQRKYLRGRAHGLNPVVQVGKQGITPDLIRAVNEALDSHELIKVKFVDFKEERKELAREIAERTSSEAAGLIGNVAILYRQQPDEQKRKILLPQADISAL
ncbi:MAG: ribosome assembly RNA-binding protein YhbY [Desulfomonilia bacterium]|nr:ribosome assembly RNA-binding protein YhbY [Deltaproteobacteria bacterium]MDX9760913.1 ribosome assembly RNA-binding protein YhbY [Desulfomonilia bacterium]HPW69088.1 ribosome assembly RNA-binding protein YhbY [Deltaproteobacteria bacterium]